MPKSKVKPKTKRKPITAKERKRLLEMSKKGAKANIGNSWWMVRATHGREAIFNTPQKLRDSCIEYFNYKRDNPMFQAEWKGKTLVGTPKAPLFTLEGMCIFLDVNTSYWAEFKRSKTAETGDFPTVIAWAENCIRQNKFEGASLGFFNANIIAQDLGMRSKLDLTSDDKPIAIPEIKVYNVAPPLSSNEDDIKP